MISLTRKQPTSAAWVYGGLILIQVLFGMNYAISKVLVGQFPPLVWASMRIIVAASVMLGITLALKRPHPKDGKKFFVPMIAFALLGAIINQASFLVGLSHTTAINSAVLNSLIPVFTILIVTLRGQEKMTPYRFIGFVLALLGVLALRRIEDFHLSSDTLLGDGLTVLNCFSFALFLSYSKKFTEQHDRLWMTTWLFIYGSVGITLMALPQYMTFQWPELDGAMWGAIAYSILGATLTAYFLNIWVLAHVPSSIAAIFVYLQPVIAAGAAWMVLGEVPTPRTVAASALIFVGMLFVLNWQQLRRGRA